MRVWEELKIPPSTPLPAPTLKQNHQRWRYSTVIHLEQSVYLTIWKDLNKGERKEQRNKIKLLKLGGLSGACLRTFGAQAVRTQDDIVDDIPNISPPISPSDIPNIYWGHIQGIPNVSTGIP